jgi:hypothetical protein
VLGQNPDLTESFMADQGSGPNTPSRNSGATPKSRSTELRRQAMRYDERYRQSDPVERWKGIVRDKLRAAADRRQRIFLRITPGFIILGLLAGAAHGLGASVETLGILASVLLVQELPRALVARRSGLVARVELSLTGARTDLSGARPRGLSALGFAGAGSVTNLLVAGVLWLVGGPWQELARCHAVWGLAQILPLNPLRGGEALSRRLGPQGRFAHALASLVLTVVTMPRPQLGPLFLLLLLAVLGALIALVKAYTESDDALSGVRSRVEEARAVLAQGDHRRASDVARQALESARSTSVRAALRQTLIWAALAREDCVEAHHELLKLDPASIDVYLLCAYLGSCGRDSEALALLDEARALGHRSAETTRLHLELLHRNGHRTAAVELAAADEALLSETDRGAVERALGTDFAPFSSGRHRGG